MSQIQRFPFILIIAGCCCILDFIPFTFAFLPFRSRSFALQKARSLSSSTTTTYKYEQSYLQNIYRQNGGWKIVSRLYSYEEDRQNNNDEYLGRKLVVGLNKYSHDTSLCAADARSEEVLFFASKERISRRKHDGGHAGTLIEEMLHTLGLYEHGIDCIERVVVNNHHHRVLPMEENIQNLDWEVKLGMNDDDEDILSEFNLLNGPHIIKHEMSHHLAHAYSAAAQAPFERGLVVVMDGMGETFSAMAAAEHEGDQSYSCDLMQEDCLSKCIPSNIKEKAAFSRHGWREGETAYTFTKDMENGGSISLKVRSSY